VPTLDDLGGDARWLVREQSVWRTDCSAEIDCVPVDISGATITAIITAGPLDTTVLKTFLVTITDGPGGLWNIQIDQADADLDPGTYWWAMEWDLGDGDEPICSGPFIVQAWVIVP